MRRIVSPRLLKDYAVKYPTARSSLETWARRVLSSNWRTPVDVKAAFNDVDPVTVKSGRTVYVFNIERNRHRLVAAIHFTTGMVYALRLMTHREYDRESWKDDL